MIEFKLIDCFQLKTKQKWASFKASLVIKYKKATIYQKLNQVILNWKKEKKKGSQWTLKSGINQSKRIERKASIASCQIILAINLNFAIAVHEFNLVFVFQPPEAIKITKIECIKLNNVMMYV